MWSSAHVSHSVDWDALKLQRVSMTDLFLYVPAWDWWGVDVGAKGRAGVEVICIQGIADAAADWTAVVPTEKKQKFINSKNVHTSP